MKHDSSPLVNTSERLILWMILYLSGRNNKQTSLHSYVYGKWEVCVTHGKWGDELTENLSMSKAYFVEPHHEYTTIIHHVTCQTNLTHYISLSGIYPVQ